MNVEELARKVRNFETLAAENPMSEAQRLALRDEVARLLESLSPSKTMAKYALGGAAAGVVLPVLGFITGGAAGAIVGAVQTNRAEVIDARQRLQALLEQLG